MHEELDTQGNILKISGLGHTVSHSHTIEYIANIVQYLSTRPGTVIGSAGTGVGRTSYPQQKLVGRTILNIIINKIIIITQRVKFTLVLCTAEQRSNYQLLRYHDDVDE